MDKTSHGVGNNDIFDAENMKGKYPTKNNYLHYPISQM